MDSKISTYPQFFNPQRLGESLKEVSSDLLRPETSTLIGRWFHGPQDIDLFLWMNDSQKIVKQQLTFYGQVVEWNIMEGNKTGAIIEEEASGLVKSSEIIQFDERAQSQPLSLAMDLIRYTNALSDDEKKQIITNFFRGQRMSDLDPNEFVEHYGYKRPQFVSWQSFSVKIKKMLRWLFKPLA